MTPAGNQLKADYQWESKLQWRQPPLKDELRVSVRFFFGTKRKAGLDNFNKPWQDALTGSVYEDDSQISELRLLSGLRQAAAEDRSHSKLKRSPVRLASRLPRSRE
jgi:Holliday junction resolvase RusA-like endonuclease